MRNLAFLVWSFVVLPVLCYSEEVRNIPFEHAQENTGKLENFENLSQSPIRIFPNPNRLNGFSIGHVFAGQYARAESYNDVTGTTATNPLSLVTKSTGNWMGKNRRLTRGTALFQYGEGFGAGGYYRHSETVSYYDSIVWRNGSEIPRTATGKQKLYDKDVLIELFGTGALSIIFDVDQKLMGFRLLRLDQPEPYRFRPNDDPDKDTAYIKFFNRDGELIEELRIRINAHPFVGFQRCLGQRDIAGIQITSNARLGIAIDDLVFDRQIPEDDDEYDFWPCTGLFS